VLNTDQVFIKKTNLHQHELEYPQKDGKSEQKTEQKSEPISEEEKEVLFQNIKEVPNCHCFDLNNGGKPSQCNLFYFVSIYSRHVQSAARQPFFIIKNSKLHKYYRPKGIKNDKMWKQSSKVKNLWPP